MRQALPLDRPTTISENALQPQDPNGRPANASTASEIYAYIAARNLLLREVEENTTEVNLRRAAAANEAAENCLRPARSPYQAQSLPEAEAARERQHCNAVKVRLAELRASLDLQHRAA